MKIEESIVENTSAWACHDCGWEISTPSVEDSKREAKAHSTKTGHHTVVGQDLVWMYEVTPDEQLKLEASMS